MTSPSVTPPARDDGLEPGTSIWAPLERPVFRALWIANLVSNLAT